MNQDEKRLLVIKEAEIIKSRLSGRHGLRLKFAIDDQEELSFYETFWFGNYLNFQEDAPNKSAAIWYYLRKKLTYLGLPIFAQDHFEELFDKTCHAHIDTNESGLCILWRNKL